jgi:pyruvate dehydrogenase phosphatase
MEMLVGDEATTVGRCGLLLPASGLLWDTLYVANVNDSCAVLGHRVVGGDVAVAERLSTEHNAVSEEVQRELATLNPVRGR